MNKLYSGILILCLLVSGCVVTETENGRTIPQVDQQKVLESHIKLGHAYAGSNNRQMAVNHLNKALAIDPHSAGALFGFAVLYQSEGEMALAEQNYRDAMRYDPSYTQAVFYFADFLSTQGRFEEAYDNFARVTKDVDYIHRSRAFVSLGVIGVELGRLQEAKASFEHSIRLTPESPLPYIELAKLYYEVSDFEQSNQYLQRFHRLSRSTASSLWLGIRLARLYDEKDLEASYGMALKNRFSKSKENLAYQQWLKNEQNL